MIDINANIAYIRRTTPAQTKKAEPAFTVCIATTQPTAPHEDAPISKTFHTCASPGCGRQTKFVHCYECNWG